MVQPLSDPEAVLSEPVRIERASVETCSSADGVVVVIDVIRAFTTAAYALAGGARDITVVGTPEAALALRETMPGALIMGEVDGALYPGFDLDNSPSQLAGVDLAGRRLIQRTSAGTQGIVRCVQAAVLLAGSFVCAGATARYIQRLAPQKVTLVITGTVLGVSGDEDAALADYLEALLHNQRPDPAPYLQRVRAAIPALAAGNPGLEQALAVDVEHCVAVDRFDFAMLVERRDGLYLLGAVR